MSVTIKEVAKLANVSPSTVSRVIADNPKISDATKDRVYKAMKEINYHPNAIARSLVSQTTKTIGLILPNTDEDLFVNPFFIQVMRGISHYAQKKGYYIMYAYSSNEDQEVEYISSLMNSRRVDGIILPTVRKDDKCVAYLKEADYPFVVIGKPESTEGVLWVDNDNFNAMYNVVNTLIQKGERKIAFIGGSPMLNVTINRLEGYKMALKNIGVEIDGNMVQLGEFTEISGYNAMKKILNTSTPTAVVTTDDLIAFGASKAISEMSKRHISIVGFNNTPLAAYRKPSLSSVDINSEELGYFAVKLLINKLENEKESIYNYIIETKLVERESTK
ncbi:LacI family transcriptional regulator [Clostridium sp. CM028]|uniref:LacI family DNA-binding transcriptional regulator n=1 Tax=Clostridium sp. CM028 TaxID=2851575 RepID=UPI001C6EBB2E|nr:LacI family DNA-binding transcriptional regulator [Clostridium sp. CM028]MBW9149470.1 LacI family transcriptional regulator [Clostridium sp. CM028]WLC62176.1 LacI family transcriptional regulator [Clostridium sp. CM028]